MAAHGGASLYPLFLKLESKLVVVVGAGAVADRKIAALLAAKARVVVVAPRATDSIAELARTGAVEWRARAFQEGDVEGAWLVIAATSDPAAQRLAAAASGARHTFIVAADDPAHATAYAGAVVARPPFTVAISSSGATPALTRLLREILEQLLPPDDWVEHATALRARWAADGTPMSARFGELVRAFKERAGR